MTSTSSFQESTNNCIGLIPQFLLRYIPSVFDLPQGALIKLQEFGTSRILARTPNQTEKLQKKGLSKQGDQALSRH